MIYTNNKKKNNKTKQKMDNILENNTMNLEDKYRYQRQFIRTKLLTYETDETNTPVEFMNEHENNRTDKSYLFKKYEGILSEYTHNMRLKLEEILHKELSNKNMWQRIRYLEDRMNNTDKSIECVVDMTKTHDDTLDWISDRNGFQQKCMMTRFAFSDMDYLHNNKRISEQEDQIQKQNKRIYEQDEQIAKLWKRFEQS